MNQAGVFISNHAIRRFRERSGAKYSDKQVRAKLTSMLALAKEVTLSPRYRVNALLNHNCRPAQYYRYADYILVVEQDTLKTIHRGEAGRWVGIARKERDAED